MSKPALLYGPMAKLRDGHATGPRPDEVTFVYGRNRGRAGLEPARLVMLAGPRAGTEIALLEAEVTVGRGSDNAVVIPDISVSRRHAILRRAGSGYVLHDQGSGNGTRVNGRDVERAPLRSGDEIALGDTVARFVEAGGVAARRGSLTPAPGDLPEVTGAHRNPLRARTPVYAGIAAVLLSLIGVGLSRRLARARAARAAAQQGEQMRTLAQQRFEEGAGLVKQGRWAEARDKLRLAAELDAQDPGISRYLERAEEEVPRAQALAGAKAALARSDFADARTQLGSVPEDSALAAEAHEVALEMRRAMEQAVREARARVEAGDSPGATVLLDPVLAAQPSRADALAVKAALAAQRRPAGRQRPVGKAAAGPHPEMHTVVEPYLAGDIDTALDRAEADPRAARALELLRAFEAAYREGVAHAQAKRTLDAIAALERADQADRALAQGRPGKLGQEVRKGLSNLHTQVALTQTADDQLAAAAAHLRAAVMDDPANEVAQQQLERVVARAKELYLSGYVAKEGDAERAKQAFRLVEGILPPEDETAQKARRWLEKLDGTVPKDDG